MKLDRLFLLTALTIISINGCNSGKTDSGSSDTKSKYIKKYRDDGTLLSITEVNKDNYANGIKVNYYEDGKTVHSKVSYNNGEKEGPALWYYKNGQVFEHTGFKENQRDGLTRKYYKSGTLMAEFTYERGKVMPGIKEYNEEGELITDYPEVTIREINRVNSENKIILEVSTSVKNSNTKFYQIGKNDLGWETRNYLDARDGSCLMEFHVNPGNTFNKTVEIYAEIPTSLGNVYIAKKSYTINV